MNAGSQPRRPAITGSGSSAERLRASHVAALLLLFSAVFLASFHPLLFDPGRQHVAGLGDADDVWTLLGPAHFFSDHSVRRGEIPLWNPLIFCGMPHAANPQNIVFYPPNAIRSLLVASATPIATLYSLSAMVWLHFLVLGVGTWWLARIHGLGPTGASVAALAMLLSERCVYAGFQHHSFLYVAAWMPWILLLLHEAVRGVSFSQRLRWGVGAGLLYAMQILAGQPQLVAIASVAELGYLVACGVAFRRSPSSGFGASLRAALTLVPFLLTVFVASGVLVAAVQLLPAAELAARSARAAQGGEGIYLEATHSALLSYQWLHGDGSSFERLRGVGRGLASVLSVPTGFLLLVLAAPFHPRRRSLLLMGGLAYLLLDCSMGPPFPIASLIHAVKPFSFTNSAYSAILAGLPVAILAGFGFEALRQRPSSSRRLWSRAGYLALVGFAFVLAFLHSPRGVAAPGPLPLAAPLAVLVCLVATPLGFRAARPLALALAVAGALAWNHDFTAGASSRPRFIEMARATPDPWLDNQRQTAVRKPNLNVWELRAAANGYEVLHTQAIADLISNPGLALRYRRGLHPQNVARNPRLSLFLKRSFWLTRAYVRAPLPEPQELFPAATLSFLPEAPDLPVPRLRPDELAASALSAAALEGENFAAVAERIREQAGSGPTTVLTYPYGAIEIPPRHSALRGAYRASAPTELSIAVVDPRTGRRSAFGELELAVAPDGSGSFEWPLPDLARASLVLRVALREGGSFEWTRLSIAEDPRDENGRIRILERSSTRVEVELLDLPEHRILLFVDAAYPGWSARVDGETVPIHLANDAFKAVIVPPGSHRVRFEFRPGSVSVGAGISLAALLTAAAALASGIFPRSGRLA